MNDEPFSTKTPDSSLPVFSQFNSCFLVLRTNILKNAISAVLPLVSFCQNFLAMLVSFSKIRVKHTSPGKRCQTEKTARTLVRAARLLRPVIGNLLVRVNGSLERSEDLPFAQRKVGFDVS